MELYVIANLHNQTVLGRKGIWISTTNSKSALRDVCWFDALAVAKAACTPYNPNTVVVLTAKNLCKRIGIKKIPGYIQENYRGSVLSRTMRVGVVEQEGLQEELSEEQRTEIDCTYDYDQIDKVPGTEKAVHDTPRKTPYLELSGCDPIVMHAGEISNIQKDLKVISDISKNWKERQETVLELLKRVEARERDLLHIVEFYDLRKEQAESVIRELHLVRCQRRHLKNEFTALSAAIRAIVNVSSATIESAIQNIEKLNTRKYCCRTITEDRLPEWLEKIVKGLEKV